MMWNNFRVLASLEIGESSRDTVRACKSAKRTYGALIEMFAPLSPAAEAPVVRDSTPPRISQALLAAYGVDHPDATEPMPLDDDMHVDLPVEEESEGDTVIELPIDDDTSGALSLPH